MRQEASFEEQVIELYTSLGHRVEHVIKQGDHTSDLVIKSHNGEKWIARCEKRDEVNSSTVRDFFQVLQTEHAKQAAIIATGVFTAELRQLLKGKPVHLIDGHEFQAYLLRARELAHKNTRLQQESLSRTITEQAAISPVNQVHTVQTKESNAPAIPPATPTGTKPRSAKPLNFSPAVILVSLVAGICLCSWVASLTTQGIGSSGILSNSNQQTQAPSYSVEGTWKWDRQRGNMYDGIYYVQFRSDGMVTYCGEDENPKACDWTASRYTVLNDSQIRIDNIGDGRLWEFSDSNNDVIKYQVNGDTLTLYRLGWEEVYLVRVK